MLNFSLLRVSIIVRRISSGSFFPIMIGRYNIKLSQSTSVISNPARPIGFSSRKRTCNILSSILSERSFHMSASDIYPSFSATSASTSICNTKNAARSGSVTGGSSAKAVALSQPESLPCVYSHRPSPFSSLQFSHQ